MPGWMMLRFALAFICLIAVSVPTGASEAELAELRQGFTLGGKPIPPEVFADLGDSDLADPTKSVRVAIDLRRAVESELYRHPISCSQDGWLSQHWVPGGHDDLAEGMSYKFFGATRSGLLVVLGVSSGGGTGRYYTLNLLDLVTAHAFDPDGQRYERLNLTAIRNIPLGDRWRGTVAIEGDTVTVATQPGPPNNSDIIETTRRIEAVRPD